MSNVKGSVKSTKSTVAAAAVNKVYCKKCDEEVLETDFAVGCEICDGWFHMECEEVSAEAYGFLKEYKNVHWYCKTCNKSVASLIKLVASLKQKVEQIDERVTVLTKKVDVNETKMNLNDQKLNDICEGQFPDAMINVIDSKINDAMNLKIGSLHSEIQGLGDQVSEAKLDTVIETKLVKSVDTIKKDLEPSWAAVVGKEVADKFKEVSKDVSNVQSVLEDTRKKAVEAREHENRSLNVIIFRVPEVDDKEERIKTDKTFCLDLFNNVLEIVFQFHFKVFLLDVLLTSFIYHNIIRKFNVMKVL